MQWLGTYYSMRQEYEHAAEWYTKGAEAGLPKAMHLLGCHLELGRGMAPPEYQAAADWYRRAANAGDGNAANNLCQMYTHGRGRA